MTLECMFAVTGMPVPPTHRWVPSPEFTQAMEETWYTILCVPIGLAVAWWAMRRLLALESASDGEMRFAAWFFTAILACPAGFVVGMIPMFACWVHGIWGVNVPLCGCR